ncbi:hypothetical protein M3210_11895 [Oceanobacillus luteolus]|uniref:hypothetical protein n=1 Tax=Oceanobacillus luteolus TaxID=1274358 RepID=UPI00204253DC|nr:hypothetical protein [Oceanobacillus luteolus]MCM3740977.1 hypothetical protein [Oceanobacillus luteolus]
MKKINSLDKGLINESGRSLIAQKNTMKQAEGRIGELQDDLEQLGNLNDVQGDKLDALLLQAEQLMKGENSSTPVSATSNFTRITEKDYENLNTLTVSDGDSWQVFMLKMDDYLVNHQIHVPKDPFDELLSKREKAELIQRVREDYKMKTAECDKYDYMIAAFCGVAAGFIDSFFVGDPNNSRLLEWTDKQVDNVVIKFTKTVWRFDKKNGAQLRKEPDTIASAIGFLERRFKVNYDARYAADLNLGENTLNMSASNHHLKSLGHSPDLIGLFFSILDQFTDRASFISDGKVIRVEPIEGTNKFELRGGNFMAKLFAGFANWLGHLMSDIAGSSGTRGHMDGRRGAGIPLPFYSLLQLFDFGSIPVQKGDKLVSETFAEFSVSVFESGYDARFGVTMAIPVAFNELAIRLLWALKSKFYHQRSWKESIPIGNKPELRRMLLVGHGALCMIDVVDGALRSGGNLLLFATRLNAVAWSRFSFAALNEVRAIYRENSLDLNVLERDLEEEWGRLFG